MRAKFKEMSKRAKWILNATGALAGINFLVFWVVAVHVGGDALNGYTQGHHFFICAHGSCHEVSEQYWKYSYWHSILAGAGIFLVFIEAAILVNTGDISLD